MTNYNDGSWWGWNGGECPVHPETVVEIQHANREQIEACDVRWTKKNFSGDVVAFRVIKEHKEPREVWMYEYEKMLDGGIIYSRWYSCNAETPGAILFREVLP